MMAMTMAIIIGIAISLTVSSDHKAEDRQQPFCQRFPGFLQVERFPIFYTFTLSSSRLTDFERETMENMFESQFLRTQQVSSWDQFAQQIKFAFSGKHSPPSSSSCSVPRPLPPLLASQPGRPQRPLHQLQQLHHSLCRGEGCHPRPHSSPPGGVSTFTITFNGTLSNVRIL